MDAEKFLIKGKQLEALMRKVAVQQKRLTKTRKKKSEFKVRWVKLPFRWIERLRAAAASENTYRLALTILVENYKLEQMATKEIVLSGKVTGLPPMVRKRASDNLVRLGLIKIKRKTGRATRVVDLYI
jgi:hypothetical protein